MQKRVIQLFTLGVVLAGLLAFAITNTFAAPVSHQPGNPAVTTVTNPYSPAYGHSYRHGAVPTIAQLRKMQAYETVHPQATGPNTLTYGGGIDGIGVTSGTPRVYLVFWGTQWGTESTNSQGDLTFSSDSAGAAPYLQNLFKGLGTGNELWSGTMTQYCDGPNVSAGASSCPSNAAHVGYPTGGALAGVWYDNSGAEPNAATGHQLAQEAVNAAAHFGNTTAASNRYAQYDILSATGTDPDSYQSGGFCAWHDYNGDTTLDGGGAVTSPYGDIAFTNMPYVLDVGTSCGENFVNSGSAGTLDGFSIVNGHEYAETITDQNPAGGWTNPSNGEEDGDECAWISSGQGASANVTMGNGHYAMQSTWSNDTNECDISHPIVGGGTPTPTPTPTNTPTPTSTPTQTPTPTPTPTQTPTPTPTSTPTPTPTPTPPPGGNLVVNPGFENGTSPWKESSSGGYEIIDTVNPHNGSYSAYLCGYDNCNDQIWQTITLPSSFTTVTFSYWTYIDTSEFSTTTCYDYFRAKLRTSSGSTIATVQTQCNLNTHGWTKYTFTVTSQLSAYKGKAIQVYFQGTTDSSLPTDFFVDDVSLTVS
ncbi:MAG TPA: carbohydrate binding domain-containing protein [Ktedonobacteraceae bacterium]|nr:carbohydrate binding domain-containing protein [Ktedonobacteraceae bacterium]